MATQTKIKTKASDMFVLAILAYLLTLLSPILGSFVSQNNAVAILILRAICIAAWIFGSWGLVKAAKTECAFTVIDKSNKPTTLQWILTAAVTVAFVAYCIVDSLPAFKDAANTLNTAMDYVMLVTYYVMNAFQALAVTLIVVFAQKACEKVFGLGKFVPWGGIALGLCWAIASLIGSTDLIIPSVEGILVPALWSLAYGIVFGIIYLVSGKKAIYALPFMAVAFILM